MFELIVRPAVIAHRRHQLAESDTAWHLRYADIGPRLHISELGNCPRAAYLRLQGCTPRPFNDYQAEVIAAGNIWEHENEKALAFHYGSPIATQRTLGNDIWAGSDDFELADLDGVDYVIEHKNTADGNFYSRLPYDFHCFQVLGYAYFLEIETKDEWHARLYYHGRGKWAEFDVWETPVSIQYEGKNNGQYMSGSLDTTLILEMAKLEKYWGDDELPPTNPTPFDFDTTFGCTKARGRKGNKVHWPSCKWFEYCWPDLPYDQPVEL